MDLDELEKQTEPESPPEVTPPEKRKLVVELEDDDDGPEDKTGGQEADKKTRRQQARDYRRQRETDQRELSEMRTQLAELRGRLSVPAPAAPAPGQPGGTDPIDAEIASLEDQQSGILQAMQAPGLAQEQVDKLVKAWRKMETHRRRLETRQVIASERGAEPAPERNEDRFVAMTLQAEFPAIFASESMKLRAQAEVTEMIERGKPRGLATAREACQRVLERAGVGRRPPAPTDVERARLSSIPARAGVAGNGSGSQFIPTKFEINLARGFTKDKPGMSDEERVRYWMKATGNRRTG